MAKSSRASAHVPQSHLAGSMPAEALSWRADGRSPTVTLTAGAVGPCSAIPGPDSIEFSGTSLALERSYGVDLSGIGDERDRVYHANDTQGHTWFVRRGGFGLHAFRERTADELAALQDGREEQACKTVSAFRLRSAQIIAIELAEMAEQLTPDKCGTRAGRRCFKKRMAALSRLQWDLLAGGLPASSARARMKALGF